MSNNIENDDVMINLVNKVQKMKQEDMDTAREIGYMVERIQRNSVVRNERIAYEKKSAKEVSKKNMVKLTATLVTLATVITMFTAYFSKFKSEAKNDSIVRTNIVEAQETLLRGGYAENNPYSYNDVFVVKDNTTESYKRLRVMYDNNDPDNCIVQVYKFCEVLNEQETNDFIKAVSYVDNGEVRYFDNMSHFLRFTGYDSYEKLESAARDIIIKQSQSDGIKKGM